MGKNVTRCYEDNAVGEENVCQELREVTEGNQRCCEHCQPPSDRMSFVIADVAGVAGGT